MLTLLLVFTNKWQLPALPFIRLSANHLNKIFETPPKDCMTCYVFTAYIWFVVVRTTTKFNIINNEKNICN